MVITSDDHMSDRRAEQRTRVRVPLVAANTAADRSVRRGEPLTVGVPMLRSAAWDADQWALVGPRNTCAAQARVLDRWSDGSIRWLLVDGRLDVDSGGTEQLYLEHRDPRVLDFAAITVRVSETDDGVMVDTGAATFSLRRNQAFPFDDVIVSDDSVLDRSVTRFTITDADGVTTAVLVDAIDIEERGPIRCSLAVTGSVRRHSKPEWLHLLARLDFYAGLPTVRLRITVRNPERARHAGGFWDLGDPNSVYLKDVSMALALPRSESRSVIRCSAESREHFTQLSGPVELYQDSSGGERWNSPNHVNHARRVTTSFQGYRLTSPDGSRTGLRATPIMSVARGHREITLAFPQFWENFPKAVEADAGVLTLRLFPGQYSDLHELQPGEQKTHECFISFCPDDVTDSPLEWCRHRTVLHARPEWYLGVDAVRFLAPTDERHSALVETAIAGRDTFVHKREAVDEYGWRHFGEVYGDHEAVRHSGPSPLVSHYNNQYDAIGGFAYQFLRSGDLRWWQLFSDLVAHVIDIDVYHTTRDKWAFNNGMFWHTYHYGDADTATHRTYPRSARGRTHGGGPSADHNYTTGLMLHYLMTGNEMSRQTVLELANYVFAMDDGDKTIFRWLARGATGLATASADAGTYHGPGRGPANSISTLLDAYRLSREPRFLQKAERLIRRVIHPADDIAARKLDEPERRWFYTMFLQALGKYLEEKQERGQLDTMYEYARASLLHYARWMAQHEYPYLDRPEKLEFPTETWAAHELRKSDTFYLAALHASEPERSQFTERGRYFFETAITTLERMPTHSLARPVVILALSGLLHSWFRLHPNATAPGAAESRDFGVPERFVPQKLVAKERLIFLTVAALLCLIVLGTVAVMIGW
jgi:PcRGLX-like protein central beta sandwich domain